MGCTGLDLGSQQVLWFGHSGKKGMSFGRSRVMAHTNCRCNLSFRDIADAIQVEAVLLVSFGTFRDVDFFFWSLSYLLFLCSSILFFLFFLPSVIMPVILSPVISPPCIVSHAANGLAAFLAAFLRRCSAHLD